jgi:hypothetical protein
MIDAQTSHLDEVVQIFFWRKTSRQMHHIRLVYTTDNFLNRLGSNLAYSPVALPCHPIQGKRRERLHDVLPIINERERLYSYSRLAHKRPQYQDYQYRCLSIFSFASIRYVGL